MDWFSTFETACESAEEDQRPVLVILEAPG